MRFLKTRFSGLFLAAFSLLALAAVPPAQAQTTPTAIITCSNIPPTVAGNTTTVSNNTLVVQQGAGLALQGTFAQMQAGTGTSTFSVYSSADGTNFTTTAFASVAVAANGTTAVVWGTNWSAAQLAGLRALKLSSFANTNASIILTNLSAFYSRPY